MPQLAPCCALAVALSLLPVSTIDKRALATPSVSAADLSLEATEAAAEDFALPTWPQEISQPEISQVDPSQNRLPDLDVPVEPLPEEPTEPTPEVSPEPAPPGLEGSIEQVQINQIQVLGSTVLSDADLQGVVAPFENRQLTVAEMQQVADAITGLYVSRGYLTSRAFLPEQTLAEGVLLIQIAEGSLEAIQVEGTTRLADYVRSRIGLGAQTPLNQRHIEDQLRLLSSDPLFEDVRGSLRPGTVAGQTILAVQVQEARSFSGSFGVDTLSSRSVGPYRVGATLQYLNLAGLGDRLSASAYRSTTGGSRVYDLSYQVPISPTNGMVLFRLAPNSFRITDPQEPSFTLGVSGYTDVYETLIRQPLVRTPREEFALSLGYRYRSGSTLVSGVITPPTRSSVFTFGQDYTRRDLTGAWSLRSQFDLGTATLAATGGAPPRADSTFLSWLGQVQRVQVLHPDHLLLVTGDVQLTPDRLLTSEQFFIGGGQSVRGFYQNARYADNGVRFSVEDRITLVRDEDNAPIFQVIPFLDVGYVWNNPPDLPNFNQTLLVGTGVGLVAQPLPNLLARVDLGVPLMTLNQLPSDRPSGLRVYFDVRYQF